ncbi:MAG: ATP-binding protein, partial [Chloroflexia bacterium]
DPQRIAQVLGNLVANSLRHTPSGGSVVLRAWVGMKDGKNAVCMSVSDTGSGIAAEDLPHIFDRFYRVDHARTRAGGGAGLGLAIAKRMIDAHGGGMWAESVVGQGTTVGFWLPMEDGTNYELRITNSQLER